MLLISVSFYPEFALDFILFYYFSFWLGFFFIVFSNVSRSSLLFSLKSLISYYVCNGELSLFSIIRLLDADRGNLNINLIRYEHTTKIIAIQFFVWKDNWLLFCNQSRKRIIF